MKFRIRFKGKTQIIELGDSSAVLLNLKHEVAGLLLLDTSAFCLSLNGSTALEGDDAASLSSLQIVSGDLIHVLLTNVAGEAAESSSPASKRSALDSKLTPSRSDSDSKMSVSSAASNSSIDRKDNAAEPQGACAMESASDMQVGTIASSVAGVSDALDTIMDAEVNRYLLEPMLVREAGDHSLPQSLSRLYANVTPHSAHEAVVVVVHVLMSELGFVIEASDAGPHTLPQSWRSKGCLRLYYTYPNLVDAQFQLLCVPICGVLVIHGYVKLLDGDSRKYQLRVKVSEYTISQSVSTAAEDMYKCSCLSRLSRMFKDTIAYPLLQFGLTDTDLGMLPGLSSLVLELQLQILKHVDAVSLLRVSQTCQTLRAVCKQQVLWRHLFLKDFGRRADMSLSQRWDKLYKDAFEAKKRLEHQRRQMETVFLTPPFMGGPYPPMPPWPFGPGSFIGGDYDWRPNPPDQFIRHAPFEMRMSPINRLNPAGNSLWQPSTVHHARAFSRLF